MTVDWTCDIETDALDRCVVAAEQLAEFRPLREPTRRQRVRERRARNREREWARLVLSARYPGTAVVDRAAGTVYLAGLRCRVTPAGSYTEHDGHGALVNAERCFDVSAGERWLGDVTDAGRIVWNRGGRTSQRVRRWRVLSAVARAWRAADGRGGARREGAD